MSADPIIAGLQALLAERSARGVAKYGTTLARTDLTPAEWAQHLLEELLDAAGYVLRLKLDLEAMAARQVARPYATLLYGGGDKPACWVGREMHLGAYPYGDADGAE